jgi:hypothetical protein
MPKELFFSTEKTEETEGLKEPQLVIKVIYNNEPKKNMRLFMM